MWALVDTRLPAHWKLRRFQLRMRDRNAPWHVVQLWLWAYEHAKDGRLDHLSHRELADICGWDGRPQRLIRELLDCKLLDSEPLRIHDWKEANGRWRARYDERQEWVRRYRANQRATRQRGFSEENTTVTGASGTPSETYFETSSETPSEAPSDLASRPVPSLTVPDLTSSSSGGGVGGGGSAPSAVGSDPDPEEPSSVRAWFGEWWREYPQSKRTGRNRDTARAAWSKLLRPIARDHHQLAGVAQLLVARVHRYAESTDVKRDGGRWTKKPAAWIADQELEPLLEEVARQDRRRAERAAPKVNGSHQERDPRASWAGVAKEPIKLPVPGGLS